MGQLVIVASVHRDSGGGCGGVFGHFPPPSAALPRMLSRYRRKLSVQKERVKYKERSSTPSSKCRQAEKNSLSDFHLFLLNFFLGSEKFAGRGRKIKKETFELS